MCYCGLVTVFGRSPLIMFVDGLISRKTCNYPPRSGEGNVFLQACVILFTGEGGVVLRGYSVGGVYLGMSVRFTGRHPPPPPEMVTVAVGTHPTGMHSCSYYDIRFFMQKNLQSL